MDIAFVSGNPHLPQVMGGVEVNTHELANELGGLAANNVGNAHTLSWIVEIARGKGDAIEAELKQHTLSDDVFNSEVKDKFKSGMVNTLEVQNLLKEISLDKRRYE